MTNDLHRPGGSRSTIRLAASKVPEVTIAFWVIKAMTTGLGESTSDYLVHVLPPVLAVAIGGIALVLALALQFATRRYVPWVYWLAVAMVGVFGTMAADVLHVGFGIPYVASTIFFAVVLAAVFLLWHRSERTLSIHSIRTRRREAFYWAAVMATFALGTAAGDLVAVTFNLGYLAAGLLFGVIILIPAVGYRFFGLNAILAFWFAYIVTRPLGASFADWVGVSSDRGGLGVGPGVVSLVLAVLIALGVGYVTITGRRESAASQAVSADPVPAPQVRP